jgi:hypothetical protein
MSGRELSTVSTLLPQFQFTEGAGRLSTKGDAFLTDRSAASARSRHGHSGMSVSRVQPRPSLGTGSAGASRRNSNAASPAANFTIETETAVIFERDLDLRQLRAHVTQDFREQFDTGLVHYLSGDWQFAREELEKANTMMKENVPTLGGDGPSLALLKYMDQYDYAAPQGWMNYRPLTSK